MLSGRTILDSLIPLLHSVLWRCWLGSRKDIRPLKNLEWWGAGVIVCLEWDADLHMAQLMPLPLTVSCFSKIQTGFTFLVPVNLGSPGKGPLNGCVYVCVFYMLILHPLNFCRNLCYLVLCLHAWIASNFSHRRSWLTAIVLFATVSHLFYPNSAHT